MKEYKSTELPQLLTVEEVAQKLKLTKFALYQMVNRRGIPFIKIGRRLRFVLDDMVRMNVKWKDWAKTDTDYKTYWGDKEFGKIVCPSEH